MHFSQVNAVGPSIGLDRPTVALTTKPMSLSLQGSQVPWRKSRHDVFEGMQPTPVTFGAMSRGERYGWIGVTFGAGLLVFVMNLISAFIQGQQHPPFHVAATVVADEAPHILAEAANQLNGVPFGTPIERNGVLMVPQTHHLVKVPIRGDEPWERMIAETATLLGIQPYGYDAAKTEAKIREDHNLEPDEVIEAGKELFIQREDFIRD